MRTHPTDDAVKAAFDRFHKSTSPKPAADSQLRRDLSAAGIRQEFKDEENER
jgi:hypothetical protein